MAGSGGQWPDSGGKSPAKPRRGPRTDRRGKSCPGSRKGPHRGSSARIRASGDQRRNATGGPRRQWRRVATTGRRQAGKAKTAHRRPETAPTAILPPMRERPPERPQRTNSATRRPSADGWPPTPKFPHLGAQSSPDDQGGRNFSLTASKGLSEAAGQEFGHVRSTHRNTASNSAKGHSNRKRWRPPKPGENRAHSHGDGLDSPEGKSACGARRAHREAPAQGFGHASTGRGMPRAARADNGETAKHAAGSGGNDRRKIARRATGRTPEAPKGKSACGARKGPREAPAQGFGHVQYDRRTSLQSEDASRQDHAPAVRRDRPQRRRGCREQPARRRRRGTGHRRPRRRPDHPGQAPAPPERQRPRPTFLTPMEPRRGPVQPPTSTGPSGAPRAIRAALAQPAGNLSNVHRAARCGQTAKARWQQRPGRTAPRISAPHSLGGPTGPRRENIHRKGGWPSPWLQRGILQCPSADRRPRRQPPSTARSEKLRPDQRHIPCRRGCRCPERHAAALRARNPAYREGTQLDRARRRHPRPRGPPPPHRMRAPWAKRPPPPSSRRNPTHSR